MLLAEIDVFEAMLLGCGITVVSVLVLTGWLRRWLSWFTTEPTTPMPVMEREPSDEEAVDAFAWSLHRRVLPVAAHLAATGKSVTMAEAVNYAIELDKMVGKAAKVAVRIEMENE